MPTAHGAAKQTLAFLFGDAPSNLEPCVADPRVIYNGLTSDNLHLSRATMVGIEDRNTAVPNHVGCNQLQMLVSKTEEPPGQVLPNDIPQTVLGLIANSIADSTRRAYGSDLAHFLAWGGTVPASPNAIAEYLAAHAGTLSVATLVRRVATISKAHEARGLPSPTSTELVKSTLRGIKRTQVRLNAHHGKRHPRRIGDKAGAEASGVVEHVVLHTPSATAAASEAKTSSNASVAGDYRGENRRECCRQRPGIG